MADALSCHPVAAADWPALAGGFADLGFEQTASYGVPAAARIGARVVYLAIRLGDICVAAAQLRLKTVPGLGRGIAWCPSGPLMCPVEGAAPDPAAVLGALRAYVQGQGHVLRLRLPVLAGHDPDVAEAALRGAGFAPTDLAGGYDTVLVDLSDGDDALLARLHGKWRNPLRNTWKAGLQVETGSYDDLYPRFRALYDEVQGAKGFAPDIPPEFYRGLSGPDFRHMTVLATLDGRDLGAVTIGLAGQSAVYLFGATGAEGRKVGAGYFLTWEGYRLARSEGAQIYDLGGVDATANPTVTRFKERAGGTRAGAQAWQAAPSGLPARLVLGAEALLRKYRARRA